jgi:S1-C subfamily serine protease
VPEILRYGKAIKPGLGVTIANDSIARRLGVEGVLLINVQPNSAADTAGLIGTRQRGGEIILGDIIESVNDEPVLSYDELRNEFDKYNVGDKVTLGILRKDSRIRVQVELESVE